MADIKWRTITSTIITVRVTQTATNLQERLLASHDGPLRGVSFVFSTYFPTLSLSTRDLGSLDVPPARRHCDNARHKPRLKLSFNHRKRQQSFGQSFSHRQRIVCLHAASWTDLKTAQLKMHVAWTRRLSFIQWDLPQDLLWWFCTVSTYTVASYHTLDASFLCSQQNYNYK